MTIHVYINKMVKFLEEAIEKMEEDFTCPICLERGNKMIKFLKEAIEKKEKRARRFHFVGEESVTQRNVFLDKDAMKKGRRRWPSPHSDSASSGCVLVLG